MEESKIDTDAEVQARADCNSAGTAAIHQRRVRETPEEEAKLVARIMASRGTRLKRLRR